jgi:hypothetical protein
MQDRSLTKNETYFLSAVLLVPTTLWICTLIYAVCWLAGIV